MTTAVEFDVNSRNEASAWHGVNDGGGALVQWWLSGPWRLCEELIKVLHPDGEARRHATTSKEVVN